MRWAKVFELGEVVEVGGDLDDVEPVAIAIVEEVGGAGELVGAFVAVNPVAEFWDFPVREAGRGRRGSR